LFKKKSAKRGGGPKKRSYLWGLAERAPKIRKRNPGEKQPLEGEKQNLRKKQQKNVGLRKKKDYKKRGGDEPIGVGVTNCKY